MSSCCPHDASAKMTGLSVPIDLSTSFEVEPGEVDFSATAMAATAPLFYARWQSPTVRACEAALAELEGSEASLCFASGMAAITGVMLHLLSAGDHVVLPEVCYAGVAEFGHDTLPRYGVAVTRVDMTDLDALRAAIRPETRLIHVETPCNPTLALTDIAEVAEIARASRARLSVDATIGSPLATQACALGADYAIHSLTKYVSGHGDVLGGVVSGAADRIDALRRDVGIHLGATMHPMSAWLTLRGLPTLRARMSCHSENAMAVARYLDAHPNVAHVHYPGLESHPQHALARRQMKNYSGLLSFSTRGDPQTTLDLLGETRTIVHAISLGKPRTLIFHLPTDALQDHAFRLGLEGETRLRGALGDGVFRLSVGLEDSKTILADLDRLLG